MKIKQKINRFAVKSLAITIALTGIMAISVFQGAYVSAQETCGGQETAIISCGDDDGKGGVEKSAIWSLLLMAITILTAGVGVAALGGIVWGAVLYTSAGGNPEQVKKAVGIFTNVAIGVIAFAGMYVLLNFIIPGGIFN
ncbi:hypothetical protein KI440_00115 [Candidatus Saccharibacteria bacterium TM7i]|nr:hypothetical protein KI440_00115 [Candidatus Saccharibacteria bacterium TM7i]